MVILVKYWAKQRGVNTPYHGTLSSYAYVLLVIFYLQTRPVPVVPVLQDLTSPNGKGKTKLIIEGNDCYFCTVRVFRPDFALKDAIGSHACSLEARTCV
jgi:terminal uridylyltransferase